MPADAASHDANPPDGEATARGGLMSRSFLGLLVTQFLGAANDNVFRWLTVPIAKDLFGRFMPDQTRADSLAVSLGLACLVVPVILLAAPAGYVADRFSKRTVIVWCKVAEVALMALGLLGLLIGNVYLLYFVVLLLGSQAAIFSPSKLGSIPEIVSANKLSAANGLVGLTTVLAVVGGSWAGLQLASVTWRTGEGLLSLWPAALALVGVAAAGWFSSLWIRPLPAANPSLAFPRNPVKQTWGDLRIVATTRPLLRVVLGVAFFWAVASLFQMNIDAYATTVLQLDQEQVGPLLAVLSLGVGIGSVLAGIWSAGRVELGIVPLGALGIAGGAMLLYTSSNSAMWTGIWLFCVGVSGGLYNIPLTAYTQHRSPPDKRGAVQAVSNFLTFGGMLLASGLFFLLRDVASLSPQRIFLLTGLATLPVLAYAVFLLPSATIRFAVWLASHTIYRLKVYGRENLPATGGALLVANHVTWLDGVFLLLSSSRPVRMLTYADYIDRWWIRGLARLMGAIPLTRGGKSVVHALDTAREALLRGELVCIFPEGGLTRSGQLHGFKRGLLSIVEGTGAPVVPVYLDELWGSIFSFQGGRFFWKRPRRWPYPVSIHFGPPLEEPLDVHRVRQAVQNLGVSAVQQRSSRTMILPRAFLRMCRRSFFRAKMADSSGAELKGHSLLLKALVFRRLLDKKLLAADERFVGLLLPPSVPAALANIALPLCGRIAVNLNYTTSVEVMNSCIAQCGIRRVLTSRRVMEKLNFQPKAELVYLEDLIKLVGRKDKLMAALQAYLTPVWLLERMLGLTKIKGDDLLTVIFTSGSTGEPKGVMLTHRNVGSNIEAIDQIVHLTKRDVALGVLPFFHSYGYTGLLWTVLTLAPKGVYHFSPLEPAQVGKLCEKHRVTLLMTTPTFLRSYLRKCEPEQLRSLEVVFASAEKLPGDLADAFEKKFGVRPVEAYGATELSPLVTANIPPARAQGASGGCKDGTVGRPIPGVAVKVVHPETGEELGVDEPGMLLVRGPNVMQGYFNRPDLTEKVIRDGWYVTGDVALIDADGFIRLTGRLSRFSKIGGEMVPHLLIEERLQQVLGAGEDNLLAVVTAVPDVRKGERLIVLHLPLEKRPGEICKELFETGLPNLWIPSADSFFQVEEIPVLGTGKLDLKRLKDLAVERVNGLA